MICSGGCLSGDNEELDPQLEEQREKFTKSLERYAQSLAVRGTIGEATWIEGLRKMDVRGYGLVVGLDGTVVAGDADDDTFSNVAAAWHRARIST